MTLRKRLGAALASLFAMSSLCAPGQAAPLVGSRALPSRVVANLYRLGSHSDSVFLVTTPEGHFLINSGSSDASDAEVRPQTLRAQMEALGFRLGDVKVLLTNHAHADHVGGHAQIRRLTGARVVVMEGDEEAVRTGVSSDYGIAVRWALPCPVDEIIHDGGHVELGGVKLTAYRTAGHTRGATTWSLHLEDGGRQLDVLLLDSTMRYPGRELFESDYPDRLRDYAESVRALKGLPADVLFDPHGGEWRGGPAILRFLRSREEALMREAQVQLRRRMDPVEWEKARERSRRDFRAWLADPATRAAFPEMQVVSGIDPSN